MLDRFWTGAASLIDALIGDEWPDEGTQRHARLIAGVVLVMFVPGLLYMVHFVAIDLVWMATAVATTMSTSLVAILWLRRSKDPQRGGVLAVTAFFLLLSLSAFSSGGFYGPNFGWLYVTPVFAALLVNMRVGAIFTGLVLLLAVGFWLASENGISMENHIPESERAVRSLFDRGGAVLAIGVAIAIVASRERLGSMKLSKAYNSLKLEMLEKEQLHDRMVHTERLASMGKLSAAVAHEINNPMTYVIGNLQALQEEGATAGDDHDELIHDALDGAMRVSALVRDMQLYSRSPEKLELVGVDIEAALDRAAKMVGNRVREGATLKVECEPGLLAKANEAQLVQVIVNLLTNALDAMTGEVKDNELTLTAKSCTEGVVIEVQDTGSGISIQVQKRLFEPFYTTKDVGQGTGMGLAISRSLIEGMKGTIRFESSDEHGTSFFVILPAATAGQRASTQSETGDDFVRVPTPAILNILVIDDDAAVLRSIRRMLGKHVVVTMEDAREALGLCLERDFDLILCDIMMPRMSGDKFYVALKEDSEELAGRVTFITGGVLTDETEEFIDSVDRPVLYKPLSMAQLRELTL